MQTKFTEKEVRELCSPLVYVFREGETAVYVGASAFGIGRPFSCNHKMMHLLENKEFTLELIPCETANLAFDLEASMIAGLKPKYNRITLVEAKRL